MGYFSNTAINIDTQLLFVIVFQATSSMHLEGVRGTLLLLHVAETGDAQTVKRLRFPLHFATGHNEFDVIKSHLEGKV